MDYIPRYTGTHSSVIYVSDLVYEYSNTVINHKFDTLYFTMWLVSSPIYTITYEYEYLICTESGISIRIYNINIRDPDNWMMNPLATTQQHTEKFHYPDNAVPH